MIVLWIITGAALLASLVANRVKTWRAIQRGLHMFVDILPLLLGVLATVSLLLAFVPAQTLVRVLSSSGVIGIVVALVVGSIALIPGFVAYPLAGVLREQGASTPVIAAFITTLMMVGVMTLPIEIRFFGRRFALLRNLLAFGGSVVVAVLMALTLP